MPQICSRRGVVRRATPRVRRTTRPRARGSRPPCARSATVGATRTAPRPACPPRCCGRRGRLSGRLRRPTTARRRKVPTRNPPAKSGARFWSPPRSRRAFGACARTARRWTGGTPPRRPRRRRRRKTRRSSRLCSANATTRGFKVKPGVWSRRWPKKKATPRRRPSRGSTRRSTRRSRFPGPWNRPPPGLCGRPWRISWSPRAPPRLPPRSRRSEAARTKPKPKTETSKIPTTWLPGCLSGTRPARSSSWRTRAGRTCVERWRRVSVFCRPRGRRSARRKKRTSRSLVRRAPRAPPWPPSSRAGRRRSGPRSRRARANETTTTTKHLAVTRRAPEEKRTTLRPLLKASRGAR